MARKRIQFLSDFHVTSPLHIIQSFGDTYVLTTGTEFLINNFDRVKARTLPIPNCFRLKYFSTANVPKSFVSCCWKGRGRTQWVLKRKIRFKLSTLKQKSAKIKLTLTINNNELIIPLH